MGSGSEKICGFLALRTLIAFMVIMSQQAKNKRSAFKKAACLANLRYSLAAIASVICVISSALFGFSATARGYALENSSWPAGTTLVVQLSLGDAGRTLQDGNTNWNAAVAPVLDMWNQQIGQLQITGVMNSTAPVANNDRVNSVAFSSTVFGQSFGQYTLAVTYYRFSSGAMIETDTLFNTAQAFDSYRGPLQFGSNGYAIVDIRRVLLHELGHGIGLAHPDSAGQNVDAVMNSVVSDRAVLSPDDIAGGQRLYGAPTSPTPTPTPGASPSHLANISTRMKVGLNDNVLIGGFIVAGTNPKKLIFRAIGPSLTAAGVAGVLADPTLELRDSAGALIASNDNWQSSSQTSEIAASGLAPASPNESAIIATLAPGGYTAIVRGNGTGVGVGMIEAYEMDSNTTRLVNISTRGRVETGDNALIGGTIVLGGTTKSVLVRAIGPSLANSIAGALTDPVLELRDSAGNLVATNDNWTTSPQYPQIAASGLAPSDPRESTVIAALSPGSYTAIVRGVNSTVGVALVELYDLDP